ncbi:uncharacterized protein LOC110419957 isoform X2 [Herrania umbratica]|uniref:Uncharacterized protein LOC110419957 isoform X2 n=1 Tax=Herrania umbratica TaxID=108875 RepID=A0A6J1AQI9_9ROSI|nr:uncharacterized protein LOC110419957 isoform X2 [Herrania umbratica]
MSKLFARIAGYFSNRTFIGVDKAGNRYFTRKEEIDGIRKRKDGWNSKESEIQPQSPEIMELEARRERVRLNVTLLKEEEEERKAREGSKKVVSSGKVGGPDLKSFIRQFPSASEGDKVEQASDERTKETQEEKGKPLPESSEPTGSGASYKPGTWQPPT